MKKIFLVALAALFLLACNDNDHDDSSTDISNIQLSTLTDITPVFTDISYPEAEYTITPDKEHLFEHSSGTEIKVSPETFVDKEGNDVKGNVSLKYKEFRSASDIIFNNIDLSYDSAYDSYQFQTAGMFNIEAYSEGKEVFIKDGKSIEVSFASDVPGDYNFYRFEDSAWVYQEPIKAIITVEESDNSEEDEDFVKLKPVKLDTKNDIVIDIKSNYNHIDDLKDYKKIIWKYAGEMSKEEIKKLLAGRVKDPSIHTSGKTGIYMYKFKKDGADHSIEITPVFTGRAYQDAMTVFNASINQTQIPQNNIRRTVNITQLGLMNYDIISKQADAIFVKADFYLYNKENDNSEFFDGQVFHISGNDDMVISQKSGMTLGFTPSYNNKLVAVLPGNKVAVLKQKDFVRSMDKVHDKKVEFYLEPLETKITKPDDLDQIVAGL
jgi:hypothetical protein